MAKRRRSGDTAKRRRWGELVKRCQQSGQTVREFCRTAEVKESAFSWWNGRLARRRVRRGGDRHAQGSVSQRTRTDVTTGRAGFQEPRQARSRPDSRNDPA